MAVLLPEPESPVTTTRRRPSVMLIWGPVQCSGASRPARFRCPQTPSACSSALALGLPLSSGGPSSARRAAPLGAGLLHLAAALEGAADRDHVDVLEVAADRDAVRDTGHADTEGLDEPGEVERRRLALGGRVGGEDHLAHRAVAQADEERLDLELVGPHPVE